MRKCLSLREKEKERREGERDRFGEKSDAHFVRNFGGPELLSPRGGVWAAEWQSEEYSSF